MSDLSSSSCRNNCNDNGLNPMMLILLLTLCGGNGCSLGGCLGNNGCNSCDNGLEGILPLILILSLCGGGSFC